MAVITASLRDVTIIQGPFDQAPAGTNYTVVACYFDSNGVTVTGGSDTLDVLTAGTQIAGFIRDGKTYTPKVLMLLQPYRSGSSNVFGTVAMATASIRLTPTTADFSTGATVTGSATVDAPFGVAVGCVVT
jgi:hypothetical protein